MIAFIFLALNTVLAIFAAIIYRSYGGLPMPELHHRVKQGNKLARLLQHVNPYVRLKLFLRLLVALFGAASAIIASHNLAWFVSFLLICGLIFGIITITHTKQKLYTKSDLINLLDQQIAAPHNRIDSAVIHQAVQALKFDEQTIASIMTPQQQIRFVPADEPVGPILSSELHDSGYQYFPVRGDQPDVVVGTLHLRDLVEYKKSGRVANIMKPPPPFIGQDESLELALTTMLSADQQLGLVIDNNQAIVGLITVKDIVQLRFKV